MHPRLRPLRAAAVALATSLAATLAVLPAAPAHADTRILCRGFSGCAAAGYGNAGYASNYRSMWWRMYAGHNCTNYAAYRMVAAGMSPTRPWSGSGNASNWGIALASRTDRVPTVGAIAWWRSRNHVQYVERVYSSSHIVVSEDHWGGDFDWAEVRKGDGSNWPDGFIHLRDAKVTNLVRPSISGTPTVDQPLKGNAGSWRPTPAITYQWLVNGRPITGATASTFTPRPVDLGKQVSLRIVAKVDGYEDGWVNSVRTVGVAPGQMSAATVPAITGVPKVGGTLTATGATFTPAATTSALQWYADGLPIEGATGTTLQLGPDQVDRRITVVTNGSRAGYATATATSAATEPVTPEDLEVTGTPRLGGSTVAGRTLELTPGEVATPGTTRTVRWLSNGRTIAGATGLSYSPTATDVGSTISASVTYAKPGYRSVAWTRSARGPVRAIPLISATSDHRRSVTIRVRADGVRTVTGVVMLSYGTHSRKLQLVNGQVEHRVWWIPLDRHRFSIHYYGSPVTTQNDVKRWVTVRR